MSRWGPVLRLIGVGWYIGACIVLGAVGGLWLDNKLNTKPILVIVGLILGVFIAFYGVYHMLIPIMGNKKDKRNS